MRRLTGIANTLAAIIVTTSPAAMVTIGSGTATATPTETGRTTFLSFAQVLRRCDFSANMYTGPAGYGTPTAVVHTTGSNEVMADVHITTVLPDTRYDVRLIQVPRPSSSGCGAGDPGTVVGAVNTDAAGAASVTLRGPIAQGATGAWLFISRPGEFSQTPDEFYTTDFVAAI
jgi:hypothetical protein